MAGLAALLRRIDGPAELPTELSPAPAAPEVTGVAATLSGIRKPGAVQSALHAVDEAREVHRLAAEKLRNLVSRRGTMDGVDGPALVAAGAAEEAAKAALRARKGELRAAIESWTPALQRLLAPHRGAAAARIVAAVNEIEAALAIIGPCDSFLGRWAIEPHPQLQMHDLRALRHSAGRIAEVEGSR